MADGTIDRAHCRARLFGAVIITCSIVLLLLGVVLTLDNRDACQQDRGNPDRVNGAFLIGYLMITLLISGLVITAIVLAVRNYRRQRPREVSHTLMTIVATLLVVWLGLTAESFAIVLVCSN